MDPIQRAIAAADHAKRCYQERTSQCTALAEALDTAQIARIKAAENLGEKVKELHDAVDCTYSICPPDDGA